MTTINATTKRGQSFIYRYEHCYEGANLSDVYGRYSRAKENAYNYCLDLCTKENGRYFQIISHNSHYFTVGWETDDGLRIETPYNSYLIK